MSATVAHASGSERYVFLPCLILLLLPLLPSVANTFASVFASFRDSV
jgi:hypothetical protein